MRDEYQIPAWSVALILAALPMLGVAAGFGAAHRWANIIQPVWRPIATAPKDGTTIELKSLYPGHSMVFTDISRWSDKAVTLDNKTHTALPITLKAKTWVELDEKGKNPDGFAISCGDPVQCYWRPVGK